jgi:possible glycosyltransferase
MNSNIPKTLNIVMLTTVTFHQSKGGTEKVMIDTANAMVKRGHNVTIILRDTKGSTPGFPLDNKVHLINCASVTTPLWLTSAFCDIRSFSFTKERHYLKRALLNLKTLASRYREAILNTPADIYITYDPRLSAMLVKEFGTSKPVVSTFQFNPQHIIRRYNFQAIKSLVAQAGPIQVLLPEFSDIIKSTIPNAHCIVIPNVVHPIAEQSELNSHVLLNVARVVPLKNQSLLVEAMEYVREKFPDWQLKIYGDINADTEYCQKIQTQITQKHLEKQIQLCGNSDKINDQLLAASIFVQPSITEGFPLALTEAMSAGLPCIGLKQCSGTNHLIRHMENGVLCENNSVDFAKAIIKLISNKELRQQLGAQARTDVRQYSPETIWERWEKFFFSLVNK